MQLAGVMAGRLAVDNGGVRQTKAARWSANSHGPRAVRLRTIGLGVLSMGRLADGLSRLRPWGFGLDRLVS